MQNNDEDTANWINGGFRVTHSAVNTVVLDSSNSNSTVVLHCDSLLQLSVGKFPEISVGNVVEIYSDLFTNFRKVFKEMFYQNKHLK